MCFRALFVACFAGVFCSLSTANTNLLADPHAGYRLNIKNAQLWASELSISPGITSKLCLERRSPSMLICIQSLQQAIAIHEIDALADGFIAGVSDQYQFIADNKRQAVEYGELGGLEAGFHLNLASLPPQRRALFLFAGVDAQLQPRLAIAYADPEQEAAAKRLFEEVLASLVSVHKP